MPNLLHILTKADDRLSHDVIATQKQDAENQIEVVDLTKGEPDYKELAQKIFKADSVQVW